MKICAVKRSSGSCGSLVYTQMNSLLNICVSRPVSKRSLVKGATDWLNVETRVHCSRGILQHGNLWSNISLTASLSLCCPAGLAWPDFTLRGLLSLVSLIRCSDNGTNGKCRLPTSASKLDIIIFINNLLFQKTHSIVSSLLNWLSSRAAPPPLRYHELTCYCLSAK